MHLISNHSARRLRLLAWCIAILSFTAIAQAQIADLNIGDPAPPLKLAELVQAPEGASADLESLRGQVIMLEFWATWCAPCLKSMPHVNDLHRQFADQGVRVIAITREAPALVKRFLEDGTIEPWVGIDDNASTGHAYGITALPTTILIDRQGKVAAITAPTNVTSEVISSLLADEAIDLPVQKIVPFSLSWDQPGSGDLTEPIAQIILKESHASGGRMFGFTAEGRLIADGTAARSLIARAYDLHSYQLDWQVPDDAKRYKLSVVAPGGNKALGRELMKTVLETSLGLSCRWETRDVETAVFRQADGDATKRVPSDLEKADGFVAGNRAMLKGGMVEDFVYWTAINVLRMPCVDESGVEGRYDFNTEWVRGDRDSFQEAIKAFGLRVEFEPRPFKLLVVEPAAQP